MKAENSEPILMSKNKYAEYLGINEKSVRNAITSGKIKNGWDSEKGKIIQHLADKEFGFVHKVPTAKAGISRSKTAAKIDGSETRKKKPGPDKDSEHVSDTSENPKKNKSGKSEAENYDFDTMTVADVIANIVIHPGLTYQQSTQRQAVLQLCTDRIKLAELEGSLVRRDAVDKALYALGSQIKQAFLAIPARIIEGILSAETKVEAINLMTDEINQAFERFSTHQGHALFKDEKAR